MKRNMKHQIEEYNYFYIGGCMNRHKTAGAKSGLVNRDIFLVV